MINPRNFQLALLLFASTTSIVLGFTNSRIHRMAAKTVGNVGGLPKLKVYALKFGIHVETAGHYGNSTA